MRVRGRQVVQRRTCVWGGRFGGWGGWCMEGVERVMGGEWVAEVVAEGR